MRTPVVVALSGGVDSAVAAARLVDAGAVVIGLTMKTADAVAGPRGQQGCCGLQDVDDARRVARHLDIPHYVVDLTDEFAAAVIQPFIRAYLHGRTPNPCVSCNTAVKFGTLLERARALGADRVATGHYARVQWDAVAGRWTLRRAADPVKDQTYVLSRLTQAQLAASVFPLGDTVKDAVRAEAAARGLPVARKPDSQEICFIPDRDYRAFVAQHAPESRRPGPIRDGGTGRILGEHPGLANFTIGQRHGLGLGGGREPWYVVGLEPSTDTVLVGHAGEGAAPAMTLEQVVWVSEAAPTEPRRVQVKIRHQHRPVPGLLEPVGDHAVQVRFDAPQRAVTPGQTAACYVGDLTLCGGIIGEAVPR